MKARTVNNPHDKFFRASMGIPQVATEFFQQHLPKELLDVAALDTLKLSSESFIDTELEEQITDLLFSVEIQGCESFFYLLCEHQSRPDPLMPYRAIKYSCGAIDAYLKKHNSKTIPLVYVMVFYNGKEKYRYSTNILDIINCPKEMIGENKVFRNFQLIDVSQVSDEACKEKIWAGIMQYFMKNIYHRNIINAINAMAHEIRMLASDESESSKSFIATLMNYVLNGGKVEEKRAIVQQLIRLFRQQ